MRNQENEEMGQSIEEGTRPIKKLPQEMLLDAFVHLPPVDVDSSLLFVSRAYNALVEKKLDVLPKHTVSIHVGPIGWILWLTQRQPNNISIEWDSPSSPEGGSSSSKHRSVAINAKTLIKMLGSERLGRIPLFAIDDDKVLAWNPALVDAICEAGAAMRRQQPTQMIDTLKIPWEVSSSLQVVRALRPTCLEMGSSSIAPEPRFSIAPTLPMETIHVVSHRRDGNSKSIYTNFFHHLINGLMADQHVVLDYDDFASIICDLSENIFFSIQLAQNEKVFSPMKLPRDILFFYKNFSAEKRTEHLDRVFGDPLEPRLYVEKLTDTIDVPDHNYYRRLEKCEWKVWKVRSPEVADPRAVGSKNTAEKYFQVMQKVEGSNEIDLAVFFLYGR